MIDPRWGQGALLDPNAYRDAVADEDVTGDDVLIVISQSCDVVCSSYELEPDVEIHIARQINEIDGNNSFGKNPRTLDLQTEIDSEQRLLRIRHHERRRLPRHVLEAALPIGQLPNRDIYHIARWTGNRYVRPALPDVFNARRAPAKDAITRLLRKDGKDLLGIYVALNTFDELQESADYRVALLTVIRSAVATDPEHFQKAVSVTNKVAALLKRPGILVLEAIAKSSAEVSLDDISYFKRLEFDYLSVRDGGAPAPD